jgi:hypothetical protein
VYVPAKIYTYCVVESTGRAEIAAVIFAKLAQDRGWNERRQNTRTRWRG